jgi:primosomal protein N' (replication factor Y)
VEQELNRFLPDMKVMRMDADTTVGKLAYDRMLEDFREGRADILLGTQMVAKGHDFPRVTLSGIVLADTSLFVSDFRAAEKTFSLLTQVIGRAGRAKDGGVAVIQTFCPKNEIIRLACTQDYEKFYEGEIGIRKELSYPPFCDIVSLTVTSSEDRRAVEDSRELLDMILKNLEGKLDDLPFSVFGPFEAGVYKLNEKYRMRIVVKCKLNSRVRAMFSSVLCEFNSSRSESTLSIDFNPLTV